MRRCHSLTMKVSTWTFTHPGVWLSWDGYDQSFSSFILACKASHLLSKKVIKYSQTTKSSIPFIQVSTLIDPSRKDSDTSLEELIFTSSVNPNADLTSSHDLRPGNLSRTVDGWNPANLTCLRPCLLDLIAITWRVESLNQVPSVFTSCAANYETKDCEDIWRYITWLINIVYIIWQYLDSQPAQNTKQNHPALDAKFGFFWFWWLIFPASESIKDKVSRFPLSRKVSVRWTPRTNWSKEEQPECFEGFLNDLGYHFRHTFFFRMLLNDAL